MAQGKEAGRKAAKAERERETEAERDEERSPAIVTREGSKGGRKKRRTHLGVCFLWPKGM